MRAIEIVEHGGPEVLRPVDRPEPELAPDGVLVRNHAVGVNFVDLQHRAGGVYPVQLPLVPGIEGAGVVVAVGSGVTQFAVGDRVAYGGPMCGDYAELTAVPEAVLVPVPPAVDLDLAAAGLLQGMTAHCLTTDVHRVAPGQWVLVQAAAGGVGSLLVQYAHARGAVVIGAASSPGKAAVVRGLGADHVLVTRGPDAVDVAAVVDQLTDGRGVDVVFDAVGRDTFDGSLAALRRCGHLVVYGQSSGPVPPFDINRLSGITAGGSRGSATLTWAALGHFTPDRETLLRRASAVLDDLGSGRLRVNVEARLPLERAADAHRLLASRSVVGKVLLLP